MTKACRYEPDLNPTYQEFAQHYRVAVMPARPYKPRDKAKVESAARVVRRWIAMRLRQRRFFSLYEANQAIRELLVQLNQRSFRKRREESRESLFQKTDKPALRPLPAERYDLSRWAQARVNIDYHAAFEHNWYSVPYTLTGELVDIRATPTTIEVFHRGRRVASHVRHGGRPHAVTQSDHRPRSHREHLEWTPSRPRQSPKFSATEDAALEQAQVFGYVAERTDGSGRHTKGDDVNRWGKQIRVKRVWLPVCDIARNGNCFVQQERP